MRFALLGDHPDGLDMAGALVDSGRHPLVVVSTPLDEAILKRLGGPAVVGDVEEILADPAVEAVLVAGPPAVRPAQLRRALQSERHVLCVHPADEKPELAYEAAMLQQDTRCVLLPLLPEGLHPALLRLRDWVIRPGQTGPAGATIGEFRLLQFERASTGEVLDNLAGGAPSIPGWDLLRALGGELIEVSSLASGEVPEAGQPLLLAGRFEKGGLFQAAFLPRQPRGWWRLVVVGATGTVELTFPQGWDGPALLQRPGADGLTEEYFERWDPWPALVAVFEQALNREPTPITWQDAVRSLELDDAARRSVERRRVNLMEYQEASEEVGFKGTMTLLGCALLWCVLLLLIASRWVPWVGWLILPLLVVFIGLQFLRYVVPAPPRDETDRPA